MTVGDEIHAGRTLSTCFPFDAVIPGPERYLLHATMIGSAG